MRSVYILSTLECSLVIGSSLGNTKSVLGLSILLSFITYQILAMESTQTQHPPANDNQMPQWSRMGQLDRSRYPRPFTKDNCIINTEEHLLNTGIDDASNELMAVEPDLSPNRVDYLEKSIKFLKTQHEEILRSLHSEIDKLRTDNKGEWMSIR